MNSSKSLRLLVSAHDFDEKGIPILVLKPSIDTRDGADKVKSRVGLERDAVTVQPDTDIYKAVNEYNHYRMANGDDGVKWILVDECQFLTSEQIDELANVVDDMDISVKCYGLRTDFKSKLFPASQRLFELADELIEVKSLCKCGSKASINARMDENGKIVTNGGQIEVGGNDRYEAICRRCYKKKKEIVNHA
jgi:thymidine kinase